MRGRRTRRSRHGRASAAPFSRRRQIRPLHVVTAGVRRVIQVAGFGCRRRSRWWLGSMGPKLLSLVDTADHQRGEIFAAVGSGKASAKLARRWSRGVWAQPCGHRRKLRQWATGAEGGRYTCAARQGLCEACSIWI
jgi:hypothetical protein